MKKPEEEENPRTSCCLIRLFGQDIRVPRFNNVENQDPNSTLGLFGLDVLASRINDQPVIYNPIPLRSVPLPRISSIDRENVQESGNEKGSLIDDRNVKKTQSLKENKGKILTLFGAEIHIPVIDSETSDSQEKSDSGTDKSKKLKSSSSSKKRKRNDDDQDQRIPLPPRKIEKKNESVIKLEGSVISRTGENGKKGKSSSISSWSKKKIKQNTDDQKPIIPLPSGFMEEIEKNKGDKPNFIYRKALKDSDTRSSQSRLLITMKLKLEEFITPEEKDETRNKKGVKVILVNPQNDRSQNLYLKWWASINNYVLNDGWNGVVSENELKVDDAIELWGYRQNSECRLAMNILKIENVESSSGSKVVSSGISTVSS